MSKGATKFRVAVTAIAAVMALAACGGGGGGGGGGTVAGNPPASSTPGAGSGSGGSGGGTQVQALSWTQTSAMAQPYHTVSMSADGNVMVAAANSGELLVSMDRGNTWIAQSTSATPLPTGRWVATDVSADGSTILAAMFDGGVYRWQSATGWVAVDVAYTAGGRAYEGVAVSSSGATTHMLTATQNGPVRYSSTGGATWVTAGGTPPMAMWRAVDIAGSTAVAVNHDGGVYISSNGGADFTQVMVEVGGTPVADGWYRAALSADGNTLVLVGNQRWAAPNTGIYVGRRADAMSQWIWTQAGSVVGEYGAVAANANGSVLVASLYSPLVATDAPGQILASVNGGAFAAITPPSATESNYRAIAINAAGTQLLVGAGEFSPNGFSGVNGNVYVSSGTIGR